MRAAYLQVLIVIQLLFLLSLQLTLWAPDGAHASVEKVAVEISRINTELDQLRIDNQLLVEDISNLKTETSAIEELARSNLGMVKQGELFVLLVE